MNTKPSIATLIRRVMYGVLYLGNLLIGAPKPQIVILCYHSAASNPWRFSIAPDVLKSQIEYMKSQYDIISFEDLKSYLKGTRTITRPSAVITFDDGYRDVLTLKDYFVQNKIRPVMYALSDPEHADRQEMANDLEIMSWEELKQLREAGWTIACHSATHPFFGALDDHGVTKQVIDAKAQLERAMDMKIHDFSFPRGRYDDRILKAVKDAGYETAVTMDDSLIGPHTNPILIPRVGVDGTHSSFEFRAISTPLAIHFRSFLKKTPIGAML